MASTYTTNLRIEKVTTGEKAGLWGTVTNTNLEILEQASSGYIAVDVAAADVTLTLSQGATSNGKNLFFKLTGTLASNRQFIMPASAERVYIVQDATVRGASNRTLDVLTASSSNIGLKKTVLWNLYELAASSTFLAFNSMHFPRKPYKSGSNFLYLFGSARYLVNFPSVLVSSGVSIQQIPVFISPPPARSLIKPYLR